MRFPRTRAVIVRAAALWLLLCAADASVVLSSALWGSGAQPPAGPSPWRAPRFSGLALADERSLQEAVSACLDRQDVACAEAALEAAGARRGSPIARAIAARVSFWASDYPTAYDTLAAAIADAEAAGAPLPAPLAAPLAQMERTLYATAGWVEERRGRFRIRYRPGPDAVLVDDVAEILERTDRFVTPLLGSSPPGETVVELFPDVRSFIAASSLTLDDVESTGVVALSKWTRLLITSPRTRGDGYDWRSSISHEYLHLVIAANSRDRVPVWLQEGLARFLEERFETGRDAFRLDRSSEGALARALRLERDGADPNDPNRLVSFEEMHPSLAKIKVFDESGQIDAVASGRRAQLAYAQVATLVQVAFTLGGEGSLAKAIAACGEGTPANVALAQAAGLTTFPQLWERWLADLRGRGLREADVAGPAPVVDGATPIDDDPVLGTRRDLANFLRLGELLAAAGRHRAALVEFGKARDPNDAESPLVGARVAASQLALGEKDSAQATLERVLDVHPDHPPSLRVLARVLSEQGRFGAAAEAVEQALSRSPFHLPSLEQAVALRTQAGDAEAASLWSKRLAALREGGGGDDLPTIHERRGLIELPRDPAVASGNAAGPPRGLKVRGGDPAPGFSARTLDGTEVSLSGLRGRVVLLDFWATWCGPCVAVMPTLSAWDAELGGAGFEVVGLSDELSSTVTRFLARQKAGGVTYGHTLALEGGEVRRAYGVSSLPTLVLVDREGRVDSVHIGAGDLSEVRARITALLAAPAGAPSTNGAR